jgi:hypothetical protein
VSTVAAFGGRPAIDVTRVLPHDLAAERAVLGAILADNGGLLLAAAVLEALDFYRDAHRRIFKAMEALHGRQSAIDFITLQAQLARTGELEDAGGPAYVSSLADGVPRSTNVAHYARIVKEKAVLRGIIDAGTSAVDRAYQSDLAGAIKQAAALVGQAELSTSPAISLPALLTERDLAMMPEPAPMVEGLTYAAQVSALVSMPGVGKSTLASALGLSVVYERPFLGHRIAASGPVVYVLGEGNVQGKVRAWKAEQGLPDDESTGFQVFPAHINLMSPRHVEAFIAHIGSVSPVVVVYDTLARCGVGADENSSRDMGLLLEAVDRVRRGTNAHQLILHHTTKDGATERGSGALRGAVDTLMKLTAADDLLTLTCEKQRDAEPFRPVSLRRVTVAGSGSYVLRLRHGVRPTAPGMVSQAQARALSILRESFGSAGATVKEWQSAVSSDIPERTFYRVKHVLCESGFVHKKGNRLVCSGLQPMPDGGDD